MRLPGYRSTFLWATVVFLLISLDELGADTIVVKDSVQAVRIAQLKGRQYYRNNAKWFNAVRYDTTFSTWTVMSTYRKEVHRKGHCPVIITRVRRVDINARTGAVTGRYKTKVKTPHPPPYF
jgi:hypothetical protein